MPESPAISDIRHVLSAEEVYHSVAGAYGTLACLAEPAPCLPKGVPQTPSFVDLRMATATESDGYRLQFHPGPPAPGGLASFAYSAVPIRVGGKTTRAFCGDARGLICFTTDGRAPRIADGLCDLASCVPLR